MRALVVSLAVHLVVLLALRQLRSAPAGEASSRVIAPPTVVVDELVVDVVSEGAGGAGGGGSVSAAGRDSIAAATGKPIPRSAEDAWEQVRVSVEKASEDGSANGDANGDANGNGNGNGDGNGDGDGDGNGNGIGLGAGGGVRVPDDIPAPPEPPAEPTLRVSKARPAKLIYPTRDREVEDEADLFVARITVDTDGDVVGARMVTTRPGRRGDQAANAIWSFRYLPALDDEGAPVKSTFEQPFQIRR